MKKVVVFRREILPLSETFIREQMLAYRTWSGVLLGLRRVRGLPLDGLVARVIGFEPPRVGGHLLDRLVRRCGLDVRIAAARLRRERAQLIHVHFGTDAVDAWPILARVNVPIVITLHGYDITVRREFLESGAEGPERGAYPAKLVSIAACANVYFIAVSEAIKERAIEFGLPADKISVQYIGVDTSAFKWNGRRMSDRPAKIVHVGRLVEKKGVRYLIEAYSQIRTHIPDARLVIVGDGPLRADLEDLAHRMSAPVEFLGAASGDRIREELSDARAFCLASVRSVNGDAEGFPIVLLEAQASGVPVVTSAHGGAIEGLVNGVTGFSFDEKDVNALAQHLKVLLTDHERADRMSRAASAFVTQNFEVTDCTGLLESLYDRIC